jgi:protein SCO1/2
MLARYLERYDESFIGLAGDAETLAQIQPDYGFFYERRETGSAAGYLVDHTASSYLIDPQGRLRAVFSFSATPETMADVIQQYVNQEGSQA